MGIEAVILTGGASRRMGSDKATLQIDGVAQAIRIVEQFTSRGIPVTTLGRTPTPSADFLPDAEEFAGPVAALARFQPRADLVFVGSCDLPAFDFRLVEVLQELVGGDGAVPVSDGFRQPLCALYRKSAFNLLPDLVSGGIRCPTKWLDRLDIREVSEQELIDRGGDPDWTRGANTPEELQRLLRKG